MSHFFFKRVDEKTVLMTLIIILKLEELRLSANLGIMIFGTFALKALGKLAKTRREKRNQMQLG